MWSAMILFTVEETIRVDIEILILLLPIIFWCCYALKQRSGRNKIVVHRIQHQCVQQPMVALCVDRMVETDSSMQSIFSSEVTFLNYVSSIESRPQLHLEDMELKLRRIKLVMDVLVEQKETSDEVVIHILPLIASAPACVPEDLWDCGLGLLGTPR